MAGFINTVGPVTGATIYIKNTLVSRDTTITLPEVTPVTADVKAMGTMSIPVWQLLENMEMSIQKVGVDLGLRKALVPGVLSLEARFTQTVLDANGNQKTIMCKAFCKGVLARIPGIGVDVGSAIENEIPYHLSRYQLFVDGQETILVDRLANIVRIAGKTLTDELSGL